ncbi:MAG: glycosyltransferase [Bacteroidales bacterium]
MKVLWFSNCVLGDKSSRGSGSWLFAMRGLIASEVSLFNITNGPVSQPVHNNYGDIEEYVLPNFRLSDGVPSKSGVEVISKIVDEIDPDIVQIWGDENYWALLFSRGLLKRPNVLLDMQGVMSSVPDVFYGGLNHCDVDIRLGLIELRYPHRSVRAKFNHYLKVKVPQEKEILSSAMLVSSQSEWVRDQIAAELNPKAKVYDTLFPLRDAFYKSEKWRKPSHSNEEIFTSASYMLPFKGIHVLLKALAILKSKHPNVCLRIAGADPLSKNSVKNSSANGYTRLLVSMISELKLQDNVLFEGPMNAEQLCERALNSDLFVCPSFVESYGSAAAEALYLGVPSVLAYSGNLPYFSSKEQSALYYPAMDYVSCAARMERLLSEPTLCNDLSLNAKRALKELCDPYAVKERQLSIYRDILNDKS